MMSKIRENLYVGDTAANANFCSEGSPITIVDLTGWLFDITPNQNWHEVMNIIAVIKNSVLSGFPTLVHCHVGLDRSPFIIACYLTIVENMMSWEAYEEVKRLHPPTLVHDEWMSWFTLK